MDMEVDWETELVSQSVVSPAPALRAREVAVGGRRRRGGSKAWGAALWLGASVVLLPVHPARGDDAACGIGQTVVRIEQKECSGGHGQPPIVVTRVCCEERPDGGSRGPAGGGPRLRCAAFAECPRVSPS